MGRPFDLRETPTVALEAKLGKIIAEKNYTRPTTLKHWRLVYRKRKGENFMRIDEAHEQLGDQPKEIPITLISDDPHESFSLFRGAFDQSRLMCGAPVRTEDADEMMRDHPAAENGAPLTQPIEEDEDGQEYVTLSDGEEIPVTQRKDFIKANRFFNREGPIDEPYGYPCSKHCSLWDRGDDADVRCNIEGTLYFYLNDHRMPDRLLRMLGVFRASGTWSQRTLMSSLQSIHKMTGGILAGLPLVLRHHMEKKKTSGGDTYNVPMPMIDPGYPPQKFLELVDQEVQKRRKRYEQLHGQAPESREDLLQTGALEGMQGRDALETMNPIDDDELDADERPDFPDELAAFFGDQKVPPRKREMLWEQHEGDIEAIKAQVQEDKEAQPEPFDDDEDFIDDANLFGED